MACDFKAILANSRWIQQELAKLTMPEQIAALYGITCQYIHTLNPGLTCDPKVRALENSGCLRCFSVAELLALNASLLCDACAQGCVVPNVLTTALAGGVVNLSYTERLVADQDNVGWVITAGSLPTGVVLDVNTGIFSGTPTIAGTYNFTVEARNACGVDSQTESIVVAASCTAPTITTAATVNATIGSAFSFQNTATGSGPMTWSLSAGTLPSGLTLDPVTGILSGVPTGTAGSFPVTVRATNACGTNTKALTITTVNATLYWGNFKAPIPSTFTSTQIKALPASGGGTLVSGTRAGNYTFAANGPPSEYQVIWIPDPLLPPTAPGSLSITASGLAIPLNPAPNTPYQSLNVDGVSGKVFLTGNANGGGFTGGNPMVIA